MSAILEIMVFLAFCITSIFSMLENIIFSGYTLLDWICGMGYISITFWGVFQLLESDTDKEGD
jgi:hypothetical protein